MERKPYSCLRCGRRFTTAVGQRRRYCPSCRGLIEYTSGFQGAPRKKSRKKSASQKYLERLETRVRVLKRLQQASRKRKKSKPRHIHF